MLQALKQKVIGSPLPFHIQDQLGRRSVAAAVRFAHVSGSDSKTSMDKTNPMLNNPTDKPAGDVMSHSFGEGYATRSDEEGFGGVYGGNESETIEGDRVIHENHPAYDKTQGSEVAEKEKARHQTEADS
ncbi:hypothetical protein Ancab_003946 [Ancistrocladus abbreviatus]